MNEYSDIFFNSFNQIMKAAYETCIDNDKEHRAAGFSPDDAALQSCLEDGYRKWLSEQFPGIGKTPAEYMEGVGFDELCGMFCRGTVICDDELPEIYVRKLLGFGDEAIDFLIATASGVKADADEDVLIPAVMAARLLGRQKCVRAVLPLIGILDSSRGVSELMQETARDALADIGPEAAGPIIEEMNSGSWSDETCEHLAMSLAEIGRNCRSDEIYSTLKNAFNTLPDKAVTAGCLARYGDGRAIPALRGYLIKNGENISRETFYDIVSAVRQLGGRIDDLKQAQKR